MQLFIAPNVKETPSKYDKLVYPYITKRGLPLAFEQGSVFWDAFCDEAIPLTIDVGDVIVSLRGSVSPDTAKIIEKGKQMSWTLTPVQGNTAELDTDLAAPPQHPREEACIAVVKKAIAEIVDELGGYISISATGNFNPVSGESGDVVEIHIASLPEPGGETPVQTEGPTTPPDETVPTPVAEAEGTVPPNPEGTVAPLPGSEAPGNASNEPGLETAPPEAPVETPVEPPAETPVDPEATQEAPPEENPTTTETPPPSPVAPEAPVEGTENPEVPGEPVPDDDQAEDDAEAAAAAEQQTPPPAV